jgi:hypothetical protein
MRLPGIADWKKGVGSRKLNIFRSKLLMSIVLMARIS